MARASTSSASEREQVRCTARTTKQFMRARGAVPLPLVRYASQGERKPDTRRFVIAYLVDASMLARFPQFYRQLKGVESALAASPRRSRQETDEPHWLCKRTSIRRDSARTRLSGSSCTVRGKRAVAGNKWIDRLGRLFVRGLRDVNARLRCQRTPRSKGAGPCPASRRTCPHIDGAAARYVTWEPVANVSIRQRRASAYAVLLRPCVMAASSSACCSIKSQTLS
jgi:hypothetical protein